MYLSITQKHLYHSYIHTNSHPPFHRPGLLKCPSWAPAAATRTATAPPETPAALAPPLPRGAGRPWRRAAARGLGDPPGAARRNDLGKQGGMEDGAHLYFLNEQTHTHMYIYICIILYYIHYTHIYMCVCIILLIIVISILYIYIYILYYLVISCFTVNLGWLKIKSGQIGGGLSTLACYEKLGLVRWTCGLA